MASNFDPKLVLRQISNDLLKDLFESHHHELDLPWDDLDETEVEPIFCARQDLVDELDEYESRNDKAVWTYIKTNEVWNLAVRFARADSLSRGRYWIKRCDVPAVEPDACPADLPSRPPARLARRRQGRRMAMQRRSSSPHRGWGQPHSGHTG